MPLKCKMSIVFNFTQTDDKLMIHNPFAGIVSIPIVFGVFFPPFRFIYHFVLEFCVIIC